MVKIIKMGRHRSQKVAIGMFKDTAFEVSRRYSQAVAKEFHSYIINVIKGQRYKWKPLTTRYLRTKRRKHLDIRIYLATKETVKHIKVRRTKKGYVVGPTKGRHSKANMSYKKLLTIMEYGSFSGNIPARPLWRPAISVFIRNGLHKR